MLTLDTSFADAVCTTFGNALFETFELVIKLVRRSGVVCATVVFVAIHADFAAPRAARSVRTRKRSGCEL